MSGDLKSEGLTTEGDLTFLVFKSESARFDFLHSEVDPGIQVLHPEVNLGIQVLNPEVDLGIQILHSEADLGISEAAGNHVERWLLVPQASLSKAMCPHRTSGTCRWSTSKPGTLRHTVGSILSST